MDAYNIFSSLPDYSDHQEERRQCNHRGFWNPNKLYAADIADTIMAALNMPRRALWPELAVFANNPWKE